MFIPFAVTFQLAVDQFNSGGVGAIGGEAHVHLAGFGEIGVEFPIGAEVPGERDVMGRVPGEDLAPLALAAFGVAFVPESADFGLDEDGLKLNGI